MSKCDFNKVVLRKKTVPEKFRTFAGRHQRLSPFYSKAIVLENKRCYFILSQLFSANVAKFYSTATLQLCAINSFCAI